MRETYPKTSDWTYEVFYTFSKQIIEGSRLPVLPESLVLDINPDNLEALETSYDLRIVQTEDGAVGIAPINARPAWRGRVI